MSGTLYLVGTPIGNLQDLSPRAAKTLAEADFIAAEDTRVTVKLLNHLGIKKTMVSYHEHNQHTQGAAIVQRLLQGENCALCTDAGMPAISDPGEALVRQCHAAGVAVVPVPGPSALIAALAASGQLTGRFVFEGFLSMNRKQRRGRLAELAVETRTMILYEAPHKLPSTLEDLLTVIEPPRSLTIARELTKLHEEIRVTTLGEAAALYRQQTPRGEFVLVLAGKEEKAPEKMSEEDAVARGISLLAEGLSPAEAARQAAAESGYPKNLLYKAIARREFVSSDWQPREETEIEAQAEPQPRATRSCHGRG